MLRAGMPPKKQRQPTLFESQEKTAAADDCTDETSGSEDPGTTEGAPIVVPGDEVRVPPLVVIVVCSPAPPALFCACRSFLFLSDSHGGTQLVDTPQPGLGAIVCDLATLPGGGNAGYGPPPFYRVSTLPLPLLLDSDCNHSCMLLSLIVFIALCPVDAPA